MIGLGLVFAWISGNYVTDENYLPIAVVLGALLVSTMFFGIGTSIYLLIPICWGLTGSVRALPLPFSVRQLVIITAGAVFISTIIFKRQKAKTVYDLLDLVLLLNLLWLAIVYFRNPVGVAALGGSERVGGKPYVDVFLGVFAYYILIRQRISPSFSVKIVNWIVVIAAFNSLAGILNVYIPSVAGKLSIFYSGFSPAEYLEATGMQDVEIGSSRLTSLQGFGATLILYIVSMINPSQLFIPNNAKYLLGYISGVIMIFLSGFRSAITGVLITTMTASMLRERFVGLVKVGFFVSILTMCCIGLSYTSLHIPLTAQRALSFLPGNWDYAAANDAKGSSEWRFEMWKIVLTSDRYIRNKIFGDGFGMLRSDYEIMLSGMYGGAGFGGVNAGQEAFMISGTYHSGPVSTIRVVGLVGLVGLVLPLLIMQSVYAYRMIKKAIRTRYQLAAYFFGMPIILQPFIFIFIFGDYAEMIVGSCFDIAMLKMISLSLGNYENRMLPTSSYN